MGGIWVVRLYCVEARGEKACQVALTCFDQLSLLGEDQQLPLDGTASRGMLVVVLWGQRVTLCDPNFVATDCTPVNTCIGRLSARGRQLIEGFVLALN